MRTFYSHCSALPRNFIFSFSYNFYSWKQVCVYCGPNKIRRNDLGIYHELIFRKTSRMLSWKQGYKTAMKKLANVYSKRVMNSSSQNEREIKINIIVVNHEKKIAICLRCLLFVATKLKNLSNA